MRPTLPQDDEDIGVLWLDATPCQPPDESCSLAPASAIQAESLSNQLLPVILVHRPEQNVNALVACVFRRPSGEIGSAK